MNRQIVTRRQRRTQRMLYCYIGFLFLWALAIALMPIGSAKKEETMALLYVSGAAFWIGAAGTIFMALKINHCRRGSYRFNGYNGGQKQLGAVHFFQNKEAIAFDAIWFASIVGFLVARLWISQITVTFLFLALVTFSFGMHCMLNGINYRYIKYEVRRDENL